MGYPLALKIASPDVVHKSRSGGVQLNLESADDAAAAWDAVTGAVAESHPDAEVHGVTLQPMRKAVDLELLMGVKQDPNFGPALLFGWGGVHAETIDDQNLGLAPVNRLLARELMRPTRVYSLVTGSDDQPGLADPETLEEILIGLSNLAVDFPEIQELDINPLAISNGDAIAVDARIKAAPAAHESPRHLSISPYPRRYEARGVETDDMRIFIRPIQPEDAPLMREMLENVSETSLYHRFFSHMSKLPRSMLIRFTQIDYDREMALVAMDEQSEEDRMVGIARVIGTPDGRRGEFAVLVGDPWQGRGIGEALLKRVLRIVRERGMETVWGTTLAENRRMAHLARDLGFDLRRDSSGDYEMTLDLRRAALGS
jgi:acetyltransferase